MNPEQQEMTPDQALGILAQASAEFKGTRQDHLFIDEAVQVLKVAIAIKAKEAVAPDRVVEEEVNPSLEQLDVLGDK